ncbi:hypothetical protein GF373_08325, partial [bacterium]|nr:hypothetical protein [bacterium]
MQCMFKKKFMKRREFIKTAGGSTLAGLVGKRAGIAVTHLADELFEAGSPDVLSLAERVLKFCVLDNIMKPQAEKWQPFLQHHWIIPGPPDGFYNGQWMWDTQFVTDLLSFVPARFLPDGIPRDSKKIIREVYQNYWDWQDWWIENKASRVGDYANDMIVGVIKSGNQEQRTFSQIPILAWGLERVFQRNGDMELLDQSLERVERFYEWWWRERDLHANGLICLGAYSGKLQHAKWETFDREVNMDGMKMTAHPTRAGRNEGEWYANRCTPGNNAYLILGERCLARLAEIAGDKEMAARRLARIEKGVQGMREHMWDEEAGTFLTVHRDTLKKIRVRTISSWIPLYAGVATQAMADRMAEELASPSFMTPLPVPTVDAADSRYHSNRFWRGDTWPPTNYQIASGLAAYGHSDLAAHIADKTISNALVHGINEKYDSQTGEPKGVTDY